MNDDVTVTKWCRGMFSPLALTTRGRVRGKTEKWDSPVRSHQTRMTANKSRYTRVVGRLNILSLLASFAREIHYTTDGNSGHGGGASAGSSSLVAKCIPVFSKSMK